jgi:hypothetical protein
VQHLGRVRLNSGSLTLFQFFHSLLVDKPDLLVARPEGLYRKFSKVIT